MPGEPGARNDPVLIDDPQASETHLRRIVIVCEREGVAAVQPVRLWPRAMRSRKVIVVTLLPSRSTGVEPIIDVEGPARSRRWR